MQIILCGKEHEQQIIGFYDEVTSYLERTVNFPKWKHNKYPASDSVKAAIDSKTMYACYDEKNAVVGAFVLNNDPQGDYEAGRWSKRLSANETLIIHSFAVLPQLQRQNLGSKILEYIIDIAKNKNAKALRLDIVPTNFPAKRLYEKHGFTCVGEYDLKRGYDDIPTFSLYELNL